MARVAIVGDGPGGVSSALLLAKKGQEATVFGADETAMHRAHLYNYLGIRAVGGTQFQEDAREQVRSFGGSFVDQKVTEVIADGEAFLVRTAKGEYPADYVVFASGKGGVELAADLGVAVKGSRVTVDEEQRCSVDRVYAVGRIVRPERSQAIISAGAGAVAALDILSREQGKDVHDWDSPPPESAL